MYLHASLPCPQPPWARGEARGAWTVTGQQYSLYPACEELVCMTLTGNTECRKQPCGTVTGDWWGGGCLLTCLMRTTRNILSYQHPRPLIPFRLTYGNRTV